MIAQQIIEDVATLQSVQVKDIVSQSRKRSTADARAIVCYILHRHLGMSSTEVGKMLNRDHSSVLVAVKKVEAWLGVPQQYYMAVTTLRAIEKHYGLKRID